MWNDSVGVSNFLCTRMFWTNVKKSPLSLLDLVSCLNPSRFVVVAIGLMPWNKPRDKEHNWRTDSVAYYSSNGR